MFELFTFLSKFYLIFYLVLMFNKRDNAKSAGHKSIEFETIPQFYLLINI